MLLTCKLPLPDRMTLAPMSPARQAAAAWVMRADADALFRLAIDHRSAHRQPPQTSPDMLVNLVCRAQRLRSSPNQVFCLTKAGR
jgi:hypothetical protein